MKDLKKDKENDRRQPGRFPCPSKYMYNHVLLNILPILPVRQDSEYPFDHFLVNIL